MQIDVAQRLVGYRRDTGYDGVDGLRALLRVALILEQQVGLELYEVGLVLLDIFSEVLGRMFPGKAVGVVVIGQQQDAQVHPLGKQHVGASDSGVNACRVAIVEQGDVVGEPVEQMDLRQGERRTGVGHHILDAALIHRDDVGLPLYHIHAVLLGNGPLGLIDAIELIGLMIDLRVGRVDIFLIDAFRA